MVTPIIPAQRVTVGSFRRACQTLRERSGLTREHVFPDWLRALGFAGEGRREITADFGPRRHVIQRGGPFSKTVKAVCKRCNNDWMGHLEEQARHYVPGWAVLSPPDPPTPFAPWGARGLRYVREDSFVDAGVSGNKFLIAANDRETEAYRDRDEADARAQRQADALAVQVAEVLGADLFVTDRQYLHEVTPDFADGVTICRAGDALTLLGLYLRSQGEFVFSHNRKGKMVFNRGMYFVVGTMELLPSAWRWTAAATQHGRGGGDDALMVLVGSLLQRVSRALQARDEVHVALNRPQNNDTAEEALAALDGVLLWLMGAVDASARFANRTLGISAPDYKVGWQRPWRAEVAEKAPKLAALLNSGTDGGNVLSILRLLRNSVHGEALESIGVASRGVRRDRTLMKLPRDDQNHLRTAFAALGGEKAWGVELLAGPETYVDPYLLLESLLPGVLRLINSIMDETLVEQLPHVSLQTTDTQPPQSDGKTLNPFAEERRQSIRWQLGF